MKRWEIVRVALIAVFFCAAPTAGDIGSCGQKDDDLDPAKFFQAKKATDCQACIQCGIKTKACKEACAPGPAPVQAFPTGCFPLVHDGEVCIHALQYASCSAYLAFEDDAAPTTPTECDFCPPGEKQ